jgi:hypothetical protein
MLVHIYGASDDLIEFDGDIKEEFYINNTSKPSRKFYVYCEDELQFTFQIKFTNSGYWQVIPQMDDKTLDEDNSNYCKDWNIQLKFFDSNFCRYSTSLTINSYGDDFKITRKRKKNG